MSMVFGRIPYKVFYLWRGVFVFPSHSYRFRSMFNVEKNKKNEKTTNKRMKKHFLTCSFGMETIFSRIFFISPRSIIISHKQQYIGGKETNNNNNNNRTKCPSQSDKERIFACF